MSALTLHSTDASETPDSSRWVDCGRDHRAHEDGVGAASSCAFNILGAADSALRYGYVIGRNLTKDAFGRSRIDGQWFFPIGRRVTRDDGSFAGTVGARGRVEYATDFYVLRPRDPAKGKGRILYEVNNRGRKMLFGNIADGHAKVKMEEVRKHLDRTHFAWIGGTGDDDPFYYRIHSPVILIEFDHQTPVALGGPRVPGKIHVHTVVRTPNGNDYGKDLLRQHYEKHRNDPLHGHRQ